MDIYQKIRNFSHFELASPIYRLVKERNAMDFDEG